MSALTSCDQGKQYFAGLITNTCLLGLACPGLPAIRVAARDKSSEPGEYARLGFSLLPQERASCFSCHADAASLFCVALQERHQRLCHLSCPDTSGSSIPAGCLSSWSSHPQSQEWLAVPLMQATQIHLHQSDTPRRPSLAKHNISAIPAEI